MHRGYIKLWRKIEDSEVWSDPYLLQMWIYCLFHANWEDKWFPWKTNKGYIRLHLKPGQFATGRDVLGEATKSNPKTAYRRLEALEKMGNIKLIKTHNCTIVEILNWDLYQGKDEKIGQPNVINNQSIKGGFEETVSSQCPANVQPMSTAKHYKKDKHYKKTSAPEKNDAVNESSRKERKGTGPFLSSTKRQGLSPSANKEIPDMILNKDFLLGVDFDDSLFNLNIKEDSLFN